MSIRHSSQLKTAGPDQEKTLLPEWRTMTVFKSIQKRRKENGPRNANQGPSTTKPGDGHAVFTLQVTPTTTPCPTLSAHTDPIFHGNSQNVTSQS